MGIISRRRFMSALAATVTGSAFGSAADGERATASTTKIRLLHSTDLFRPHVDPDDHYDLASVYALAYAGQAELAAVIIDFPPPERDPDVMTVAQMNYIANLGVPVVVGVPREVKSPNDVPRSEQNAVHSVLDILRSSGEPVVIHVTGCARTVALAGRAEPRLFAEKCAAIYLNAGTGSPEAALAAKLEYNVALDAAAYAAIFELPCPIYWMPCFERMDRANVVREFGTFWRFRQDRILPYLSPRMQNFFAFMLGKADKSLWLRQLLGPPDTALLAEHGGRYRNMWCTAGFLHAVGKTVTRDGSIVGLGERPEDSVFSFDPIGISCDDGGITQWTMDKTARKRYIFHVRDIDNYESAMTVATKSLLTSLP